MFYRWLKKQKVRSLILSLGVASVFITLGNSFYASYEVQRDLLIENTLEANRVYAAKLADVANAFIKTSQSHLAYSAALLSAHMNNPELLNSETLRLHTQSNQFNSVVIVNTEGVIISSSPRAMALDGLKISTENARQSLNAKRLLVANPFVSPAGNYLVSLSQPIFSPHGDYLGYISAAIYLEQDNILRSLLATHDYKDGSYLYVVDRNRTLIYHPNAERIGEVVTINKAVNQVVQGIEGTQTIFNSKGIEMLAGFAPVTQAGWGVVAQRPLEATLAPLNGHISRIVIKSLPLVLVTLLGIWFASTLIARPLRHLAKKTSPIDPAPVQNMNHVQAWYYEAQQLKQAIMNSMDVLNERITQLHSDSQTDPMTGLLNRRGMQQVLEQHAANNIPFAVLMLDIDHFKQINDTYGHDMGDKIICLFANILKEFERPNDALCRSGGEEFIALLPHTTQQQAFELAEQFRTHFSQYKMPTNVQVTVSIGVAYWPGLPMPIHKVLKKVDEALYQAKQEGRDRTVQVN
ncbi:diguanylate cyclase [Aliidiomarina quisquiliarum]|uniref:sensor domain-containing diguanylate cyclase n=1 Tax=Aliidiomarina quisquiliarum TaxID=2938947 RepID=UPI00208DEF7B|nr:sensor domain-containing diguanylate cyclase [Aliidiomarina quisquiliarum]MCO4320044.1 sensor domain-containing diguanylate cyclase [Aliidiomarina quisquiliarum]